MSDSQTLPKAVFAGIHLAKDGFHTACISDQSKPIVCEKITVGRDLTATVTSWFRRYAKEHNYKFMAVGITGSGPIGEVASRLWLELDIFPFKLAENISERYEEVVNSNADYVASLFNEDNSFTAKVGKSGEVKVLPFISLKYYEEYSKREDFELLLTLTERFRGKKISFVSATAQGGGVALMRHALVRLYRALGVNVSWNILSEDRRVFEITKRKFHNTLQGVARDDVKLSKQDIKLYEVWIAKNAKRFVPIFAESDLLVVDDPQPAGLIPHIRKANKDVKIVYRSHIELKNNKSSAWKYLSKFVDMADIFVSHPIESFVPGSVEHKKVVFMPATTDPLDGLNKELADEQKEYYLRMFDQLLIVDGQKPLERSRNYIIQIARFDPSKGIADVMEAYKLLRVMLERNLPPQLVIVGNSSVDDPDGEPIYKWVMDALGSPEYASIRDDVKVLRLPPYDQLLNALLRGSYLALQLSHAEGFEVKVTEALMKAKPVIAYKAGGIVLQVKDGVSGYLLDVGDIEGVAERMFELITSEAKYERMSADAPRNVNPDANNVKNAVRWLELADKLL